MDIASRLKIFMNHIGLASSQFADTAGIPRPTLSQLLTGRNKKVSDELITKIHDAFPALSISWLMFGEGNMETIPYTQFSEPQNNVLDIDNQSQTIENNNVNRPTETFYNPSGFSPENFDRNYKTKPEDNINEFYKEKIPKAPLTVNIPSTKGKRITNIVVFYDDNSFESFSPA